MGGSAVAPGLAGGQGSFMYVWDGSAPAPLNGGEGGFSPGFVPIPAPTLPVWYPSLNGWFAPTHIGSDWPCEQQVGQAPLHNRPPLLAGSPSRLHAPASWPPAPAAAAPHHAAPRRCPRWRLAGRS